MNVLPMVVSAALVLGAAIYAQLHVARFTANPRSALLVRGGLFILGLVFGYVAADNFSQTDVPALMTFLIAFGAVHVPAALILFIKSMAGAGKS